MIKVCNCSLKYVWIWLTDHWQNNIYILLYKNDIPLVLIGMFWELFLHKPNFGSANLYPKFNKNVDPVRIQFSPSLWSLLIDCPFWDPIKDAVLEGGGKAVIWD